MSQEIKVNAEVREVSGSSAARRCRRAGAVPAVLARLDGSSQMLTLNAHDFERMLSKHLSEHLVLTLSINGKDALALLREIQRHGVTGKVLHADFGEITSDHKLHVQIPVVLSGDPDGVRNGGGVLEQTVREIDVACFPGDVVEQFVVDVTELKVGEALLVSDLKLGEKFAVLTHGDVAVATVVAATVEAVPEAIEGAELAQPAVVTKKKVEG